jgi:RNA polymerase sigma-54 factor
MDLEMQLAQQARQIQVLSQQARIGIQILQLPLLELRNYLEQEALENPLLEEEKPEADNDSDDDLSIFEYLADRQSDLPTTMRGSDPDEDKKQRYREMSITKEETLEDHLLWQLGMHLSGQEYAVGEFIIGNLDDNGYLNVSAADIDNRFEVGIKKIEEIIFLIQSFDPVGVAARDLRECLLAQLRFRGKEDTHCWRVVERFLDEFGRKKYPLIARKLGVTAEELDQVRLEIMTLDPKPGRAYSAEQAVKIIPDLILKKEHDRYVVEHNSRYLPSLRISKYYLQMLKEKKLDKNARDYLKKRRERARCLMGALAQSQSTIRRIAECVVEYQKEFLEYGASHIKPLKLTDVAQQLGVNESTVSRAIAHKYIQTDYGMLALKRFFSVGVRQADGNTVSAESIRDKVRELVEAEQPGKPLSDQRIVEILKEQGIDIARRTVAKYRKSMKILSSNLRR